jgi:hypothetical protein
MAICISLNIPEWKKLNNQSVQMWSHFSLVLHGIFIIFLVKLSNQVTCVSL